MSLLSVLGIAPAAEAWAVPSRRLLGLFSGPDVVFADEGAARKAAKGGKVTPLVWADDDGQDDEEQAGPFGGGGFGGGLGTGFGGRG